MHKHAVEICLDRALGHVEVTSDFRVVTSLEQQIDDLPFPCSQLAELFSHNDCTCPTPETGQRARNLGPLLTSGFGSLRLNLHSRGQIASPDVTFVRKYWLRAFPCINSGRGGHGRQISGGESVQFCSVSKVYHLVQSSHIPHQERDFTRKCFPQPGPARPL
jgi:hypothetical protein